METWQNLFMHTLRQLSLIFMEGFLMSVLYDGHSISILRKPLCFFLINFKTKIKKETLAKAWLSSCYNIKDTRNHIVSWTFNNVKRNYRWKKYNGLSFNKETSNVSQLLWYNELQLRNVNAAYTGILISK